MLGKRTVKFGAMPLWRLCPIFSGGSNEAKTTILAGLQLRAGYLWALRGGINKLPITTLNVAVFTVH